MIVRNISAFILKGLLTFYKGIFPTHCCRFMPSCSEYCIECIQRHGFIRGGLYTMSRLSRCHPWSNKSGYDPVQE
jgi:uncharacterized protein